MSYIRQYIDSTRKQTPETVAVQQQYDLPGLNASPEQINNYKREYNESLSTLHATVSWEEGEEQSWYIHMCRLLAKIGQYTEEDVREGFELD